MTSIKRKLESLPATPAVASSSVAKKPRRYMPGLGSAKDYTPDVQLLVDGERALKSGDRLQLAALHAPMCRYLMNACRRGKERLADVRPVIDMKAVPQLTDAQYTELHSVMREILTGVAERLPDETTVNGIAPEAYAEHIASIPPFDAEVVESMALARAHSNNDAPRDISRVDHIPESVFIPFGL